MAVIGLTALLMGLVGAWVSVNNQQKFFENLYFEKGQSIARSIDAAISDKDLKDTTNLRSSLYKFLLLNPDLLEITIYIEKSGQLIPLVSTSISQESSKDKISNRDAFEKNSTISHKEFEQSYDRTVLEIFVPLHITGRIIGTYNIVISLESFDEAVKTQTYNLINLAIIAVFIFVFGTALLVRQIVSKRLNRLIISTKEIESGNFTIKKRAWANDEIGDLAEAFYKMADKLKYSYAELEKRVEEKTKSLSQALNITREQNKVLEENKSAMLNLLEDAKNLEDELEKEKKGVEAKVEERTRELKNAKNKISEGWFMLHQEKARLSSSINNLSLGFIMIDMENRIILTNPSVKNLLGEELIGKTVVDFQKIIGENIDLIDLLKKCQEEKKAIKINNVAFNLKYFKIIITPIISEEKTHIGSIFLIEDITEAKIIERSRDEFFSIASHELRTPLTAIRGNSDLIEQYFGDQIKDPQFKEMIGDIHESTIRLINIVNDFLETSRLELGKIDFKKEKVDLVQLISKTIQEFQVTGSRKKLYLEFEKPTKSIPEVDADVARTKEVFINLVGNSLKYTETGGVKVTVNQEDGFVKVSVIDTGRGISPEGQKLLFRKFQQTGDSLFTRDTTKGTGLGLYISKLMIKGMGGKIWLEKSEEKKGSIFSFTLPIA
ncbi:PAS domain-containing protein [Candidatus Roizmanbacteria bacterium]|nr:PAS domain-containing protein [Candidatus Roizmanbacteria bacterium]